jgi:cyanophycin synthetase
MNGVRPPNGRLLLGVGTAGDRRDDVFLRLGEIAGLGADIVEITHKAKYLRGRSMDELDQLIRAGAARAGMGIEREHDSELDCLVSLVCQARDGDVVAVMTHQDRDKLDQWLIDHRGSRDTARGACWSGSLPTRQDRQRAGLPVRSARCSDRGRLCWR